MNEEKHSGETCNLFIKQEDACINNKNDKKTKRDDKYFALRVNQKEI